MKQRIVTNHIKGQKHIGKTDWRKVSSRLNSPQIDDDNPDYAFEPGKVFKKEKNDKS